MTQMECSPPRLAEHAERRAARMVAWMALGYFSLALALFAMAQQ
jgi:hypothetical protein